VIPPLLLAHSRPRSVKIVLDNQGRSRGFGFVAYDSQEEATKALTQLACEYTDIIPILLLLYPYYPHLLTAAAKFVGSKPIYVAKFQRKAERQQQLAIQYMTLRQQQQMQNAYGMYPYMNMMPMPSQFAFQQNRRVPQAMSGAPQQRFPAPNQFSRPAGMPPGANFSGPRPSRPMNASVRILYFYL
jgi:polyadenylate-binding protein